MSKTHENRRKTRAVQLAKDLKGKDSRHQLANQYNIIREDLRKLRSDLSRGYDMAKEAADKRSIIRELLKLRESL